MSDQPRHDDLAGAAAPGSGKQTWHPPVLEEVDYSATEAAGVGGTYDFAIYTASV
jgi:hypothetical protein